MSTMTVGALRRKLGAYPEDIPVRILDFTGDAGDVGMEMKPRRDNPACVLQWEPMDEDEEG